METFCVTEKGMKFTVSGPTCHYPNPYNKKNLYELKINNFSWTQQRYEVSGQTAILNLDRQVNMENHSQYTLGKKIKQAGTLKW